MAGQNYAKFMGAVEALLPLHLASSNEKLIRTRWLVGISLLLSAGFCKHALNLPLAEHLFYLLAGVILCYNLILARMSKRIDEANDDFYRRRLRQLVLWQIILDWLSIGVFLHLTGGVTSPALPLFFIHMLLVTVLLRDESPLPHAMMAVTIVMSITVMEAADILPHYVILDLPPDLHTNGYYVAGQILFLSIALFSAVYLSSSVIRRLRQRERQISALFLATQAVSSSLELEEVLNRLAENTAHALGVFGSSIRYWMLVANG